MEPTADPRAGEQALPPCDAGLDRVVIVHGTFAHVDTDDGQRFFQRGSDFWLRLNAKLDGVAACHPESGAIFHWSGENSEAAREAAARSLFEEWLVDLERQGQPYHIVAHSHGGSVVWAALKLAAESGRRLDGLRTWITVGTPFIHFRPAYAKLLLIIPLLLCGDFAYQGAVAAGSFFREVGSADPAYWDTVIGGALSAVILTILAIFLLGQAATTVLRILQVRRQRKIQRTALASFGHRYVGLWSTEDEAISGLIHTTLNDMPGLFPRLYRDTDQAGTERQSVAGRLARRLLRPIARLHDELVAAPIDDFMWSLLRRKGQGADQHGTTVACVSAGPIPGLAFQALPASVHAALVEQAAEGARSAVRNARSLLGVSALERRGMSWMMSRLSLQGSELIHTIYFASQPVCEIIIAAIAHFATPTGASGGQRTGEPTRDACWVRKAVARFASDVHVVTSSSLWRGLTDDTHDGWRQRFGRTGTMTAARQMIWFALLVLLAGTMLRSFLDPYLPITQVREVLKNARFDELAVISTYRGGAEYDWRKIERRFVDGWGSAMRDVASSAGASPLRKAFNDAVDKMYSALLVGEQSVDRLLVEVEAAQAYAALGRVEDAQATIDHVRSAAGGLQHRKEDVYLAVARYHAAFARSGALERSLRQLVDAVGGMNVEPRSVYRATALRLACQAGLGAFAQELQIELVNESEALSGGDAKSVWTAANIHLQMAEAYASCGAVASATAFWQSALALLQRTPPVVVRLYFQKRLIAMLPQIGPVEGALVVVADAIATIRGDTTDQYAAHDAPDLIAWLAGVGFTDQARTVAALAKGYRPTQPLDVRLRYARGDLATFTASGWIPALVHDLAMADRSADAERVIAHARAEAVRLDDGSARSASLAQVAIGMLELGRVRGARLLAEQCLARDRLAVYSAILRWYWRLPP